MSCSSSISGSGFEEVLSCCPSVRVEFPEELFFGAIIPSPLIKIEFFLFLPAGMLRESSSMDPFLEVLQATSLR